MWPLVLPVNIKDRLQMATGIACERIHSIRDPSGNCWTERFTVGFKSLQAGFIKCQIRASACSFISLLFRKEGRGDAQFLNFIYINLACGYAAQKAM